MTIPVPSRANVLWFLPTHGDGRYLGTTEGAREVSHRYLRQIAQAADDLGYYGALLPTGRSCEDSWVVASSLAPLTERLRFLVAVRPGLLLAPPQVFAQRLSQPLLARCAFAAPLCAGLWRFSHTAMQRRATDRVKQ